MGILAVGGMVIGLVAGMTAPLATAGTAASPSPAPVSFFDLNARADAPAKPAPAAAAVTTEIRSVQSPLTSDDPVVPVTSVVQCPEGTIPGIVDAQGNESDCVAISG